MNSDATSYPRPKSVQRLGSISSRRDPKRADSIGNVHPECNLSTGRNQLDRVLREAPGTPELDLPHLICQENSKH